MNSPLQSACNPVRTGSDEVMQTWERELVGWRGLTRNETELRLD